MGHPRLHIDGLPIRRYSKVMQYFGAFIQYYFENEPVSGPHTTLRTKFIAAFLCLLCHGTNKVCLTFALKPNFVVVLMDNHGVVAADQLGKPSQVDNIGAAATIIDLR